MTRTNLVKWAALAAIGVLCALLAWKSQAATGEGDRLASGVPGGALVRRRLHRLEVDKGEIDLVQRFHGVAHGVADPVGTEKRGVAVHLDVELGPRLGPDLAGDHPVDAHHAIHVAGHRNNPLHQLWLGGPSGEVVQVTAGLQALADLPKWLVQQAGSAGRAAAGRHKIRAQNGNDTGQTEISREGLTSACIHAIIGG